MVAPLLAIHNPDHLVDHLQLRNDYFSLVFSSLILALVWVLRVVSLVAIYVSFVRVAHFGITSRISRILMEHIEIKNSLDSKLQTYSICSIKILDILEVIAKTNFSKIAKCETLSFVQWLTLELVLVLVVFSIAV